ncbi:MAG: pyroglutamyl-peptidase I [Clostridia bacterium]|nr:pyroglutamyl-peptidase I [Clostridia bacterium]
MKKLLISAFEPFGGEEINPAKEAVLRLQGEGIHKLILPVEYETAGRLLFSEIGRVKPDIVIMVGQAGGRDAVTPEKRAVNERNAKAPDNAGRVCGGEKILEGGSSELFATLDPAVLADAVLKEGIPARVSGSAGTFVCNDVFYQILSCLSGTPVKADFIHLPWCLEQAPRHPGKFCLPIDTMVRALEAAVKAARGE